MGNPRARDLATVYWDKEATVVNYSIKIAPHKLCKLSPVTKTLRKGPG